MPLNADTAGRLRGRIGFLTESPGLWDRLTVRENLAVYARLYPIDDPARIVGELIECLRARALRRRQDRTAVEGTAPEGRHRPRVAP